MSCSLSKKTDSGELNSTNEKIIVFGKSHFPVDYWKLTPQKRSEFIIAVHSFDSQNFVELKETIEFIDLPNVLVHKIDSRLFHLYEQESKSHSSYTDFTRQFLGRIDLSGDTVVLINAFCSEQLSRRVDYRNQLVFYDDNAQCSWQAIYRSQTNLLTWKK